MNPIKTQPLKVMSTIRVPGSKSYTHRILIAAALSDGKCRISNPLKSEDTLLTADGLRQMLDRKILPFTVVRANFFHVRMWSIYAIPALPSAC